MEKTKEKKTKVRVPHEKVGFTKGKYSEYTIKAHSLKFAALYDEGRVWIRYLLAGIVGLVAAVLIQFVVKNTGIYSAGLSAIIQGVARIVQSIMNVNHVDSGVVTLVYNILFWVAYFILNIPLFVIGYKFVGKTFTKLTFVFLVVQTAVGLGLSYIPGIEDVFIFGNSVPATNYTIDGVKYVNQLNEWGIFVTPFSFGTNIAFYDQAQSLVIYTPQYDSIKSLYLIIYGIAYGLITGGLYSVLYIISACSAGLDFISYYFSVTKQKSINNLLVIINLISMFLGVLMGSYCAAGIACSECWGYQWFFSANFVASVLSVVVFKAILARLYPSDVYVRIDVYSNETEAIVNTLANAKYTHTSTIFKGIGTYSKKEHSMLQTICMISELPRVIELIRQADAKSLIVAYELKDIDGKFKRIIQGSV